MMSHAKARKDTASATSNFTVDNAFLKSAAQSYAVIDDSKAVDLCAVFAQGDRRRRPIGWIRKVDVKALHENGHLKRGRKGLMFTYAAERALIEDRWVLRPGLDINEGDEQVVYVPSGVQRTVKRRSGGQILRRLAKDRTLDGHSFLSSHELEAGEQFQRDYERAYGSAMSGQNFASMQVDYTRQNQQELAALTRIDAGKSYQAAKAALGSGLELAVDVICGEGKTFARLEREQSWVRGSGRIILKLALQRLSDHYGTRPGHL